jgi:molybdopterin-containing oxidoreductase family iron-sulfur binding subunit
MSHRDHHHHEHEIEPIREKLRRVKGREFWRSLEELADTDKFREFLHREFPALNAPEADPLMLDPVGRRSFLKLMSASLAFAGLTACTVQPTEHAVPYVQNPEGLIPGRAYFFATAMPLHGVADGLLVESHEGRPTKIEGNPEHPSSQGATNVWAQASILNLYDPDRSQSVLFKGEISRWGDLLDQLQKALDTQRGKQGAGLRILTETTTSPTLGAQMKAILAAFPAARWHQYEPGGAHSARQGSQLAFGQYVNTVYKFDAADVVLSLDADFLIEGTGALRYARDFVNRRRLVDGKTEMSRLYVVESKVSPTGAKADHRLPLKASEVEAFARAVAAEVGVGGVTGSVSGEAAKFASAVAKDLKAHQGKCIVVAGQHQPASVHALAHALNAALGSVGTTVVYTDSLEPQPDDQFASLKTLVDDLNAGRVEVLVIISANPVYTAPRDLKFADALQKAGLRIHMGSHNDETAQYCQWHIPESHYLEDWSDARAFDGTVSIIQPLILPLYESKSPHELLAALLGQNKASYDIVRDYWRTQFGADFENKWKKSVHDGVVENTALPVKQVAVKGDLAASLPQPATVGREIVFRLDPHVLDGRYANNGWLQEVPKPITKVTWDNFAMISPKTATALGLAPDKEWHAGNAKLVNLKHGGEELALPAWVQPGHPDDSVTVYLGYGRQRAGLVGNGLGFDTYRLRRSDTPWIATANVDFVSVGDTYLLASTQEHFNIDASRIPWEGEHDLTERQVVRTTTLEEYKKDPEALRRGAQKVPKELTMYPGFEYTGYAWGMAIDMNACIGCNSCVVACYSENNIAVVGKDLISRGRIMHWLRIDTYFRGDEVNPEIYFQPMLCQHCEVAPCEPVCPVNAAVHDAEGLNLQVYNRCVGTRYCANNCPYKVRRFNFLLYGDWETPSLKNMRNPEVTMRSRGVMEKCTYCTQRIQLGKIEAEKQGRKVRDGEIQTACQTACPTEAIIFGDINDPNSRVRKLKQEPRNYDVLADLNTRPRTSYLAEIRNPNPELGSQSSSHSSGEVKHG